MKEIHNNYIAIFSVISLELASEEETIPHDYMKNYLLLEIFRIS